VSNLFFRAINHCFARSLRSLNREDNDKYTLTITYTGILAVFMQFKPHIWRM